MRIQSGLAPCVGLLEKGLVLAKVNAMVASAKAVVDSQANFDATRVVHRSIRFVVADCVAFGARGPFPAVWSCGVIAIATAPPPCTWRAYTGT